MLKALPGVLDAGVSYANRSVEVQYAPELIGMKGLQKAVSQIDYEQLPHYHGNKVIKSHGT